MKSINKLITQIKEGTIDPGIIKNIPPKELLNLIETNDDFSVQLDNTNRSSGVLYLLPHSL